MSPTTMLSLMSLRVTQAQNHPTHTSSLLGGGFGGGEYSALASVRGREQGERGGRNAVGVMPRPAPPRPARPRLLGGWLSLIG